MANPAVVTAMGLGALVLPFLSAVLKHLKLDFESQLEQGFAPYLVVLNWVVNSLRPEWVALLLLGFTGVAYLWARPRRQDAFWDFTVRHANPGGFKARFAVALNAGLDSGKRAALIGGAAGLALGGVILAVVSRFSDGEKLWNAGAILLGGVPLLGLLAGGVVGAAVGFVDEWRAAEG